MPVRHLTVTSCPQLQFLFLECSFWVGPAHGWLFTTHHYSYPCTPVSTCDITEHCCPMLFSFWKSCAFWNSPSPRLSALLVRATCDEWEWSVCGMLLAGENRSPGRETPLSVTLSSMNPLWTGLQLYLGIHSYVRSVTNCLSDGTARRRETMRRKISRI